MRGYKEFYVAIPKHKDRNKEQEALCVGCFMSQNLILVLHLDVAVGVWSYTCN